MDVSGRQGTVLGSTGCFDTDVGKSRISREQLISFLRLKFKRDGQIVPKE